MVPTLPVAFIFLLFGSPVFSQSTSLNDPFRAITDHAPRQKQPENPICCLKPLTPSEPVDDGVLLSFEEWKMKQLGMQRATSVKAEELDAIHRAAAAGGGTEGGTSGGDPGNTSDSVVPSSGHNTGSGTSTEASSQERSNFSPSKAPLTDRFNYASLDCSARVHTAHRSAKSPSSILSSKRDRYMLSPCDTPKEGQYVVVELCDDIRIDTIQLANFEFFSGVFKDFTVSVAKTYTMDPDAWTTVQTYRAKNTRGVQTFRPPDDLRDFYRFIRIDFHSHYGNEYYCPVSLLRVYGLTHLEEWKWDIWESESRAKQAELQKKKQLPASANPPPMPSPIVDDISDTGGKPSTENAPVPHTGNTSPKPLSSASSAPPPSSHQSLSTPPHQDPPNTPQVQETTHYVAHNLHPLDTFATPSLTDPNFSEHSIDAYVTPSLSTQYIPTPTTSQEIISNIPSPDKTGNAATETGHPSAPASSPPTASQSHTISYASQVTHTSHHANSYPSSAETSTVVISSDSPSVAVIPLSPVHSVAKGGESIYRTILNRLAEVEINQTLYMRYIEQQNLAIRDVMKRLVEDVGRLEGITRAHTLNYQRNLDSWQRQRSQLEMEYVDLVLRVEHLSEEIVLEKRLGVAQLCLLLAVLVFMGLTRGSRTGGFIDHSSSRLNQSVRQWGERHFKLSNSWADRFKGKNLSLDLRRTRSNSEKSGHSSRSRSRSTSRTRTPQAFSRPKQLASGKNYPTPLLLKYQDHDTGLPFPSGSKTPLSAININTAPAHTDFFPRPHSRNGFSTAVPRTRVPSLRSTPRRQRPATPVTTGAFRPQLLQRSSSHHGGVVAGAGVGALPSSGSWGVPKSAKKWARTAHLHEVKTAGPARRARKRSGENVSVGLAHVGVAVDEVRAHTPREFEFGFGGKGKEKAKDDEAEVFGRVVFPSASPSYEDGLLFKPPGVVSTPVDEGDVWVDTDSIDGSELDAELGNAPGPTSTSHSRSVASLS